MTDPVPTTEDPTAAELAALRKEKADRDAADRKQRDDELAELRTYRTEQEAAAAKRVKAPAPKADKETPRTDADPKVVEPAKRTHGAAKSWFGN